MAEKPSHMEMRRAMIRAVAVLGSSRLGRELGITPQAVMQWRVCPPRHVLAVERLTGVSRHELRPDYYPMER